jgi:hypothetical protein
MPVSNTQAQKCPGRKSAVENDLYPNTIREMMLVIATARDTSKTVVTIPSIPKSAGGLIKFGYTSTVGILLKRSTDNSSTFSFTDTSVRH